MGKPGRTSRVIASGGLGGALLFGAMTLAPSFARPGDEPQLNVLAHPARLSDAASGDASTMTVRQLGKTRRFVVAADIDPTTWNTIKTEGGISHPPVLCEFTTWGRPVRVIQPVRFPSAPINDRSAPPKVQAIVHSDGTVWGHCEQRGRIYDSYKGYRISHPVTRVKAILWLETTVQDPYLPRPLLKDRFKLKAETRIKR